MRPLTMKHEVESLRRQLGLPVPLKVDLGVGRNWRVAHL
jgi:DNA polymerase-1